MIACTTAANGPISGALLVNGNLVVGDALDPKRYNLLIEISPTAGVVTTKMEVRAARSLASSRCQRPSRPWGSYGDTNTQTNMIYFNDDNDNTLKLLTQ